MQADRSAFGPVMSCVFCPKQQSGTSHVARQIDAFEMLAGSLPSHCPTNDGVCDEANQSDLCV